MMRAHSLSAAVVAVLLTVVAPAGALEIEPSLELAEIYTSNVNLDPDGREESEWVTQLMPGIEVLYEGRRLELALNYALEALFYAEDSDRNEVYNQLSSAALFDVVAEELQLRANVSISQVNLEPEETIANSNINTTGNRTDATTWSAGPQWRKGLFGGSEVEGHAFFGNVDYDDEATQDVRTTNARISFHTDERTNPTVTYDLAYEYDRLEYDIAGETIVQTAYLELGYRINDTYRLFAVGGFDNDFISTGGDDESLDEPRWEAGVAAEFTEDLFRIAVGHRHFGATFALSWDHLEPNATYSLRYSEAPSTSDLAVLRQLPVTPPGEPVTPLPGSDIERPGDPTRYILKRADAIASWLLYRTTVTLNAFWEDREDQVLITEEATSGTGLEDERSYGLNLDLTWDIGSRSKVHVGAGWRDRMINDFGEAGSGELPISEEDQLYTLQAGIDYLLGLRTSLGFATGFRTRQGSTADESGDYDEYWASVRLVRTF
jgi:hypothetical protein